jgi:hypothetical protein
MPGAGRADGDVTRPHHLRTRSQPRAISRVHLLLQKIHGPPPAEDAATIFPYELIDNARLHGSPSTVPRSITLGLTNRRGCPFNRFGSK